MERHKTIEKKFEKGMHKGVKIVFAIIFGILIAFLIGYVVMWLWNWLMPDLFGLTTITYWQAVGILILAKLFFGFGDCSSNSNSKRKRKFKSKKNSPFRKDFCDWKHYDKFWEEEGKTAYQNYIERQSEK